MLETVWKGRLQKTHLPFGEVPMDRQAWAASRPRVTPNRRPAWSYGLGAAACLLVCLVFLLGGSFSSGRLLGSVF